MGVTVKIIIRLLSVAVLSTGLNSVVRAADMPIRALPPPVPVFSWTGFYLGAHVGYDWQDSSAAWNPLPSPAAFGVNAQTGSTNGSSMLGGIHGGFNYEFWGAWVAGVEGDFSWTKAGTNSTQAWVTPAGVLVGGGAATAMNTTLNDLSSVRGRLGYALWPSVLLYGTGGAAWGRITYSGNAFNPANGYLSSSAFTNTASGWVAGGGIEWMFWHNWTVRWEYLHYDLSASQAVTAAGRPAGFAAFPSGFSWSGMTVDEVRAGLTYKF